MWSLEIQDSQMFSEKGQLHFTKKYQGSQQEKWDGQNTVTQMPHGRLESMDGPQSTLMLVVEGILRAAI